MFLRKSEKRRGGTHALRQIRTHCCQPLAIRTCTKNIVWKMHTDERVLTCFVIGYWVRLPSEKWLISVFENVRGHEKTKISFRVFMQTGWHLKAKQLKPKGGLEPGWPRKVEKYQYSKTLYWSSFFVIFHHFLFQCDNFLISLVRHPS